MSAKLQHLATVKLADKLVYRVTQYFFFQQWLKACANDNHIEIVGDMPIYVARKIPSTTIGQIISLRQMPLVKSNLHRRMSTRWVFCYWSALGEPNLWLGKPWTRRRLQMVDWTLARKLQDLHYRCLSTLPQFRILLGNSTAGSDTAPGKWWKVQRYKLFAAVKEELSELNIVAEDLGFMTDEVIELRERTGFPGMKILQFAFNPEDESIDSPLGTCQLCYVHRNTR